jgi:hypothetical protein
MNQRFSPNINGKNHDVDETPLHCALRNDIGLKQPALRLPLGTMRCLRGRQRGCSERKS